MSVQQRYTLILTHHIHDRASFSIYQMQLGGSLTPKIFPPHWIEISAFTHVTKLKITLVAPFGKRNWLIASSFFNWYQQYLKRDVISEPFFMTSCGICASLTSSRSLIAFLYLELNEKYLRLHFDFLIFWQS